MTEETNLDPEDIGAEEPTAETLTGEMLWNIAIGEEPCEDRKLRTNARKWASLQMRQQGIPYREIAATLGLALSTVFEYVKHEMTKRIDEGVEVVRALHLDRLETMLAKQLERANEGDTFAVTAALQIMGRIESLLGMEPPKRVEHTFGDEARDQSRNALAKAIAAANEQVADRRDTEDAEPTRH